MLKRIVLLVFIFLVSFTLFSQSNLAHRKQVEQQIVLLKNKQNSIPILHLEKNNMAVVRNNSSTDFFVKTLQKYAKIEEIYVDDLLTNKRQPIELHNFDILIFPIVTTTDLAFLSKIKTSKKRIVIVFSKDVLKALLKKDFLYEVLIFAPNHQKIAQEYAAQLIFGGIAARGSLSEKINEKYHTYYGLASPKIRLKYTIPEEEGMDSDFINQKVDSIMKAGIKNHAFPGAQLLVAKDNNVIFHKTYGYHTYDSLVKVQKNDLYDLASVTKVTGALPALMKLVEEHKLNLDTPFSQYWYSWKHKKNKKKLTLREILAHQAGLEPYIVFLNKAMKKGHFKRRFLRNKPSAKFSRIAYDGIYVNKRFRNKMYRIIKRSKVAEVKKYKYSGLSFLIYPKLISDLTKTPYRIYLQNNFYKPLGAYTMGFTPKTKHFKNAIVPTENDTFFRKTLVKGWVHDENAALLGGVSGNAGLFATANDLVKLVQMYVQFGSYGGKRYLQENTLQEFTKIQYPKNENRRGLGFDKPKIGNDTLPLNKAYPAPEVSKQSFGHAGFTGTFIWADPENQLVFIFLSNRVYPTRKNRNLYQLNIRPALQEVFYKALEK